MYAVIKTGGKQYKVQVGDIVRVEHLQGMGAVSFQPLLVSKNDHIQVGSPVVQGATVHAEIVGETKGKKLIVYKFRRRKGYRRKNGHRQLYTNIKITDIQL